MEIINGTQIANEVKETLKKDIQTNLLDKNLPAPKLVAIMVGNNPASQIYVGGKVKACSKVGVQSEVYTLPEDTKESEVELLISKLNADKSVDGIILQLPLPKHLDEQKLVNKICPEKDVDGFTTTNLGKLMQQDSSGLFSCTPSGIMKLLHSYDVPIKGKDVVIINRSLIVGKPLAMMFLSEHATVTVCHSKTVNLKEKTKLADIVVVGVGIRNFLTKDMVKQDAVVIDVGINRDENAEKKLCGDADFDEVSKVASLITPVPGGVGPMTIATLLRNTYIACMKKYKDNDITIS